MKPCCRKTYRYVTDCDGGRLVDAATRIAADLAGPAKFDPPAAYRNPDSFATSISYRELGFCDPRPMALVTWYAIIAIRSDVAFNNAGWAACLHVWYVDECAFDGEVKEAVEVAALFQFSLQMAAFRMNAFDGVPADTRRAMFVGF